MLAAMATVEFWHGKVLFESFGIQGGVCAGISDGYCVGGFEVSPGRIAVRGKVTRIGETVNDKTVQLTDWSVRLREAWSGEQ